MTIFREIRELFDVWDNSSGISEEEIVECERRLNINLPETLRLYYLQLGANAQINQTQDRLILPSGLSIDDAFIVFYGENQYVWQAGIKLEMVK